MTPRPVAIIGAGYAGLACAVELARRQVPVSVFERGHDQSLQSLPLHSLKRSR